MAYHRHGCCRTPYILGPSHIQSTATWVLSTSHPHPDHPAQYKKRLRASWYSNPTTQHNAPMQIMHCKCSSDVSGLDYSHKPKHLEGPTGPPKLFLAPGEREHSSTALMEAEQVTMAVSSWSATHRLFLHADRAWLVTGTVTGIDDNAALPPIDEVGSGVPIHVGNCLSLDV